MRVLALARHAKAEPWGSQASDHARALELRGRKDSRVLADELRDGGFAPQVALVSDALRTVQTWKVASQAWEGVEVDVRADLYACSVETMLAAVRGVPDGADHVIVVGHEPTISATAALLAGPGSAKDAVKRAGRGISTGMAAVLEFDGDWAEIAAEACRLRAVVGRGEG